MAGGSALLRLECDSTPDASFFLMEVDMTGINITIRFSLPYVRILNGVVNKRYTVHRSLLVVTRLIAFAD